MSEGVAMQQAADADHCPWCGSAVPKAKFIEIRDRIAQQERNKLASEKARLEQEIRTEWKQREAKLNAENDRKVAAALAERDRVTAAAREAEARTAAKAKDLESKEARIRKEAADEATAKAKADADKAMSLLTAQRDQALAKAKESEEANQKALQQVRTAMEKDRDLQLLKVGAERTRERGQFEKTIDALKRQLQRKTADELGEGAELDIYEILREVFPRDDIARIKKGQPGADIRHTVLHKGKPCGTILIDSKNRQGWQNSYVTKLREDQMAAKAEYALLATTVFPSGKKELHVDDETKVILVSRARAIELVGLLRQLMIKLHVLGLSIEERSEKRELLFKYVSSDDGRQHLIEATRLTADILDLDVDEQKAHEKTWAKRGRMAARLRNVIREFDTEISAIIEGKPHEPSDATTH
jgi:hypothetical protein